MFKSEVATIGFSPYNQVLEDLDIELTQYESQGEAVAGLNLRLLSKNKLPNLIICCAGVDQCLYDDLLIARERMDERIPIMVYDQAFCTRRKRDAQLLGADYYVAEPVADEKMTEKIETILQRQKEALPKI